MNPSRLLPIAKKTLSSMAKKSTNIGVEKVITPLNSKKSQMNKRLSEDVELEKYIEEEFDRQKCGLELIASENFTSLGVMQCLGSVLTNKYSEGLPGRRYYGGNEIIDKIESLCINRALEAFDLNKEQWGVNVQPYSGSTANLALYNGILNPHDRIMGLDLPSGGHLTHGFYTAKKKVSVTSIYYESLPYHIGKDGYIDYDRLEQDARNFKPKLIVCGYSAYPRDLDYERFRQIANINNSYLLCDMAHFSGLVAAKELKNPFAYCDFVTSTTHKTLRGPRAGLIFFKKEFEKQINESVFPGMQGGPHEHQIAALAFQLKEVKSDFFKTYIQQVKANAKQMGESLMSRGYKIISDGTENHLVLCDLKSKGITGSKIESICEYVNISLNKNSVPGDKSALSPGGIRIGSPALTTRGFKENDFEKVIDFLDRAVQIALKIQEKSGKSLKKFKQEFENYPELQILKKEINDFASTFEFYKI